MSKMSTNYMMTKLKTWISGKLGNITALIPSQASSSNKLADKAFVNSSIATNTATFRGNYNAVTDLSLSYNATHAQIETALALKMEELTIQPDNNDYAFVQIPTADATPTQIAKTEKYKYNGTAWAFEYELNNSGFTAAQWAAINSNATLEIIGKLSALPTNAELITLLNGKQDVISDLSTIRSGASAGATAVQPASMASTIVDTVAESGVFDLSVHNAVNGVPATYADLSAALTALNALPADYKKGGMSVKYVQSSDNKYLQCRLMATAWSTDVADWQGVDDVPKEGSDNLVKSGGVYSSTPTVADSTAESDLDISDEEGNVLIQAKDGHIRTKNFDSSAIKRENLDETLQNKLEYPISIDDVEDVDLNISDEEGNVLVRFEDGHIKTKNFDSSKGEQGEGKDWSEYTDIVLPFPIKPAIINIICKRIPQSNNKDDNLTGFLEYSDRLGNYFKKAISKFNKQGRSSLLFPKSNFSFDITDESKIAFGNWVAQDSFHLKANYIDAFRGGRSIVSYHVQTEISDLNTWEDARPWRKINKDEVSIYNSTGNETLDLNSNALGVPDGFPCELYVNGNFYGLYTLNLKKHRDNMAMSNVNAKNIQLDGEDFHIFFLGADNIDWTKFEVRNPKNLVYATAESDAASARKYDADVSQREIAGETTSVLASIWDSNVTYAKNALVTYNDRMFLSLVNSNLGNIPVPCTNPKNVFKNATVYWIDITFTNEVKQYIRRFANSNSAITSKEDFDDYLDSAWSIDYVLQVNAFMNIDCIRNNTQWCTWDGNKWFPMAYDQDQCYGLYWSGAKIRGNDSETQNQRPDSVIIGYTQGIQRDTPLTKLFTLFKSDMDIRYKELIDKGILTTSHIVSLLNNWVAAIGIDNYNKEFSKWNETPSYRSNGTYQSYPTDGGFYDSITRVAKYMRIRENFLKQYFNY